MNKTGKTAVVSIYPGIGDIVWHLPFFRALAEKAEKKKDIFIYKTNYFSKRNFRIRRNNC